MELSLNWQRCISWDILKSVGVPVAAKQERRKVNLGLSVSFQWLADSRTSYIAHLFGSASARDDSVLASRTTQRKCWLILRCFNCHLARRQRLWENAFSFCWIVFCFFSFLSLSLSLSLFLQPNFFFQLTKQQPRKHFYKCTYASACWTNLKRTSQKRKTCLQFLNNFQWMTHIMFLTKCCTKDLVISNFISPTTISKSRILYWHKLIHIHICTKGLKQRKMMWNCKVKMRYADKIQCFN